MGVIDTARSAQRASQKKLEGRVVTVTRSATTITVFATVGETRAEEVTDNNILVSVRHRDYFIDVVEYTLSGGPKIDDRITDDGLTFIVTDTFNDTASRHVDRVSRKTWRIHCIERTV